MDELFIEASDRSPEIRFGKGFISIRGQSIPPDPRTYYKPVLQWIKGYTMAPAEYTEIWLNIDYTDTGSTKAIFEILKLLAVCQKSNAGIGMIFNWVYQKEDYDIRELGEFLAEKLNVTFNYMEE